MRWLSYSLLFSLVILWMPREIVHTHVSSKMDKTIEVDHDHDLEHFDEECFLCGFILQPALVPLSFRFNFPQSLLVKCISAVDSYIVDDLVFTLKLRGPPSLSFFQS